MVIKAILDISIGGIGKLHKTSIFPCGIFQCMKGINREPDEPNYDLFRLALKSTSQRLYPNYANVDWSGNTGYDKEDPKTYFSTMGCVESNEIVTYKFNGKLYVEAFKRMWNRLSDYFDKKQQLEGNSDNLYLEVNGVQIYDTEKGFVNVKKVIRNLSSEWVNVKMSHGRSLICTADHPFHTNRGKIRADELTEKDIVNINPSQYYEENLVFDEHKAWLLGFILCDGCYDGHISSSIAFDTEDDIENAYINRMKECFDSEVKVVERHRGKKGNYKDLCSVGQVSDIIDYLSTKFEGLTKNRRHIPNEVFSWNYNAKLNFLAGMIDADGYINPTTHNGSVVQIGSTNKELALQQMALAQSLGMPCAVYQNHYSRTNPNAIRYRVEFAPSDELLTFIVSEKKTNNYVENYTNYTFYKSEINSVTPVNNMNEYSYDVETESDHFEVSGIYSHNCRTANGYDINGFEQLKDGRGNICPVTIIMPTLAMEAKQSFEREDSFSIPYNSVEDEFFNLLNTKIYEAKDMLIERFNWICSQSPDSAKFMYENGVMEGYIPEEGIASALKHGTLAIGQIGLAETLQILIGCNHTTSEGMELAKRIEQLFKDRCAEFKKEYQLNFGVYFTPAENLCFTAMKKFKERYGEIPNVSDKKFFTNSMHVPVWEEMNPFEKIDIESQLTGYSSAGCITYVELQSTVKNNIDALEDIVNYAMDKDIPYFAVNVPNDTCLTCGYCDEIGNTCPMCGHEEIQRLRRVTGYLTGNYTTAFNEGKQQEVEMRVKHDKRYIK
jgi:ribonucleoside-triphosphate reductase